MLSASQLGAAYVLNYRIIADEGATAASVVGYLLPLVAVGLGWLVVDEAVTPAILTGVVLVLLGVLLSRRRQAASVVRSVGRRQAVDGDVRT